MIVVNARIEATEETIDAMRDAILTMEQVAAYREALTHRNAGLARTRVVASLASE